MKAETVAERHTQGLTDFERLFALQSRICEKVPLPSRSSKARKNKRAPCGFPWCVTKKKKAKGGFAPQFAGTPHRKEKSCRLSDPTSTARKGDGKWRAPLEDSLAMEAVLFYDTPLMDTVVLLSARSRINNSIGSFGASVRVAPSFHRPTSRFPLFLISACFFLLCFVFRSARYSNRRLKNKDKIQSITATV
jgi:hypothetical protein